MISMQRRGGWAARGSGFRPDVAFEFVAKVGWDEGLETGGVGTVVVAVEDLADRVEAGDDGGGGVGDVEGELLADGAELGAEFVEEFGDGVAGLGGDEGGVGVLFAEAGDRGVDAEAVGTTINVGLSAAWSSARTSWTAAICSSALGWLTSTTWRRR